MNKMFLSNNLPYFDALTNQTKPGYEYLTDLKKRNKPSLSDTQLLAIYSTITAFDYAKLDSGPKLLVFGIGHDTLFWCKANKNGKTFFFESDEHIIEKYSKDIFEELPNQYTDVNVVGVNYAAQIRYRTEYFIEPWLIDVPAPIEEECYDVILIDGPYGQRNSDVSENVDNFNILRLYVKKKKTARKDGSSILFSGDREEMYSKTREENTSLSGVPYNNMAFSDFDTKVQNFLTGFEFINEVKRKNRKISDNQLLAIYSTIKIYQQDKPDRTPKLLVFGLGLDTVFWCKANQNGQTYIFESEDNLILKYTAEVFEKLPKESTQINIVPVDFLAKVESADEFFKNPWIISVPQEIKNVCYDVIFIDTPQRDNPSVDGLGNPGKMESAFYAVENAKQCILNGSLDEVYIFLGDIDRQLERQIIQDFFWEAEQFVTVADEKGDLGGWKLNYNSLSVKNTYLNKN
ncbi:hypothetical protein HK099_004803 [Clydaea vesicula]|uniref:Uncharacterized protein n=1 Tax=Clydaea vesicula TaxID=447962 RepID=A0AAD5U061_9FUNG|nr:hypothetical protein HK099_004803 [Clydaea vesicula]